MMSDGRMREVGSADLAALAQEPVPRKPAWTHQSDDLNVNLLVFDGTDGIAAHVNEEVAVLLVAIAGHGVVEVEGVEHVLAAGQALVIPKGTRRAMRGDSERFAYLSCHKRRAGLWPHNVPRPG